MRAPCKSLQRDLDAGTFGTASSTSLRSIQDRRIHAGACARIAQLEQANHELDAFTRQVAHELRTPIGQVIGMAQLMLAHLVGAQDPYLQSWLTLQIESATRMCETVNALLNLARLEEATPERHDIDLTELCETIAAHLAEAHAGRSVAWCIQPGMRVNADQQQICLALQNLLSNSVKYTRDTPAAEICVQCNPTPNGFVVVEVSDNGMGFDQSQAERLFQPFFRSPEAQRFPGAGIGLSIVDRVAKAHGGWVRANGTPGMGARFSFGLTVPMERESCEPLVPQTR